MLGLVTSRAEIAGFMVAARLDFSSIDRRIAICTERFGVLIGLILMAAALRLVPHPSNFMPVSAVALFGGACFAGKRVTFLAPLTAMLVSNLAIGSLAGDLLQGLHPSLCFVYGSFALAVCLGHGRRRYRCADSIAAAVLAGLVLFFVITDFGQWSLSPMHSKA